MRLRSLSWKVAAAFAFLMGMPMIAEARAESGVGGIIGNALGLAGSIIDVAGSS